MKWPWKRRCSQCKREVPENKMLKSAKMANGTWVKVCPNCYSIMGRPNQRVNIIGKKPVARKPNPRKTRNPNQLRLF